MHRLNERLVLIVDDSQVNVHILRNLLVNAGFEVVVAVDSAAAIASATRELPGIVLLDIGLPDADGFETCRQLKASPATRDVSVIFITASTDIASKLKGLRAGAVDYITKPFTGEEILARVNVHAELRAVTRRLIDSKERLEQRVEERTAELTQALDLLERARIDLSAANNALERQAELRERELQETREQLRTELAAREQAELTRAALQAEIIDVQRAMLAELSTPLIPITDWLVVIPMIGTMSAERAQQMLEAALAGVHSQGARVVIIDVTGVKVVDPAIASRLIQAASTLRLIGAETVVSGVRPDLAQAMAELDIDLCGLVTQGNLKSAIAYALRRFGQSQRRPK